MYFHLPFLIIYAPDIEEDAWYSLNAILSLYNRVTNKTLIISKIFGIEGKKLLTPDDDYDALKVFNQEYEGTQTPIEKIHLEYQELLKYQMKKLRK